METTKVQCNANFKPAVSQDEFSDVKFLTSTVFFCQTCKRLFKFSTQLVACENPNLNVSQGEYCNGLWDAFLQLVLYGCGTQQLKKTINQIAKELNHSDFQCKKKGLNYFYVKLFKPFRLKCQQIFTTSGAMKKSASITKGDISFSLMSLQRTYLAHKFPFSQIYINWLERNSLKNYKTVTDHHVLLYLLIHSGQSLLPAAGGLGSTVVTLRPHLPLVLAQIPVGQRQSPQTVCRILLMAKVKIDTC